MTEMKTIHIKRRVPTGWRRWKQSTSSVGYRQDDRDENNQSSNPHLRAYNDLSESNRMVWYSHWIRASNDLLTSIFELNRPTFEWRKVCSRNENHKKSKFHKHKWRREPKVSSRLHLGGRSPSDVDQRYLQHHGIRNIFADDKFLLKLNNKKWVKQKEFANKNYQGV